MAKKSIKFEDQLELLKDITKALESGELPLEESLSLFEKGIQLYKQCNDLLVDAERRVSVLMADGETKTFSELEDEA